MRRTTSIVLLCVLVSWACEPKSQRVSGPKSPGTPATLVAPAELQLTGGIELPSTIPAEAFAVAAVRSPGPWFGVLAALDPFGASSDDLAELRSAIDELTRTRLGLALTGVHSAYAFALDQDSFATVIDGVDGEPRGTPVSQRVVALAGHPVLHAAKLEHRLVIGTPDAVAAAIAAADDPTRRLAPKAAIASWFRDHTDRAAIAIAFDASLGPKSLTRELPGVERASLVVGAKRLSFVLDGEPVLLQELAETFAAGTKRGLDQLHRVTSTAIEGDDTAVAMAAVIGSWQAKRIAKLLQPVIEGRRLRVEIPLAADNSATFIAVLGISSAIAIPAFTKYLRRSKTSEARVQIAKMFDRASAYFMEEQAAARGTAKLAARAKHLCANDGRAAGDAGVTPPLSVDCNLGPGGRCVPTVGPSDKPGSYDAKLWSGNPVWRALGFEQEQAHYFHYNFSWANSGKGFGQCQFTAQAFGNFDGDGVFSTYERSGAADEEGINAAAGLYIDQEVE